MADQDVAWGLRPADLPDSINKAYAAAWYTTRIAGLPATASEGGF
jgi:hypothetical protein